MKLTDYIIDLGRVVAYYPGLKKVTESTTATILLCQLLYWTSKSNEDWIWKDSNDIEEETGLTYNEQRTARKTLIDKGLIKEQYKRLDHMIKFKVCEDELNQQWESVSGNKSKETASKSKPKKSIEELREEMEVAKEDAKKVKAEREEKNKDRDWLVDAVGSERAKQANAVVEQKKEISENITKILNVNPVGSRWQKFIDFAYNQKKNENRDVNVFLHWAIRHDFDVRYWTPEKMITMYPQAYTKDENFKLEDFVKKLPDKKDEDYAPMPKDL